MKFYKLAMAGDAIDLEEEVNTMIDQGFEPFGSPFVGHDERYYQAMLREYPEGKTASETYADYIEEYFSSEVDSMTDEEFEDYRDRMREEYGTLLRRRNNDETPEESIEPPLIGNSDLANIHTVTDVSGDDVTGDEKDDEDDNTDTNEKGKG